MNAKLLPLLALTAMTACVEEPDEARAFAEALPTAADLEMSVTDHTQTARTGDELDPFYSLTREVSGSVNGFVGGWLGLLHDITRFPAHPDGEGAFYWGPFHQGEGGLAPTTEYLRVARHPEGGYAYQLVEAPRADEDDPDAYVAIVSGRLIDGDTVQRSHGYFAVDFDAALAMDPGRDTEGVAVIGYDFTGAHTADLGGGPLVIAAMDGVGDIGTDHPEYAIYGYVRQPGGAGVMDLYAESDIGASGATEIWDVRSRWTADGEGRTDGQATGGDLGSMVVTLSDCWEGYTTVFYEDDRGLSEPYGDEADCAFDRPSLPDGALPDWFMDALGG